MAFDHAGRAETRLWRSAFLAAMLLVMIGISLHNGTISSQSADLGHDTRSTLFQHSESNTSLVTMDPGSTGNENATCPGIDGEVYTYSANDTCFMAKHCEEYQFDSFINYAIFYYCGNCSVGALCVIFFFIPMSVSIFYLLSMASEDFFCPVLSDISLHLNLSPEIAGITILAFGNGSADVFSTIAAIHEGNFNIALGEMMGTACFVTMIVVGSVVFLARTVSLKARSFCTDVIFLIAAVTFLAVLLSGSQIELWQAGILCIGYIFYVGVSVIGTFIGERSDRNRRGEAQPLLSASEGECEGGEDLPLGAYSLNRDQESNIDGLRAEVYLARVGLIAQDATTGRVTTWSPKKLMDSLTRHSPVKSPLAREDYTIIADSDLDDEDDMQRREHPRNFEENVYYGNMTYNSPNTVVTDSPEGASIDIHEKTWRELTAREEAATTWKEVLVVTFLRGKDYCEWNHKSIFEKILFLVFLPAFLAMLVTIPRVPLGRDYWRWPAILYPSFGPLMIGLIAHLYDIDTLGIPLMVLIEICGIILSVVLYMKVSPSHPPPFRSVYMPIAFFMAMIWIFFIARELVSILTILGKILSIPDAVMGLTILAWGNSVGDMVADITVAKKGFPSMALAATYGGPLFNLLLGFGIAITFEIMSKGVPYTSPTGQFLDPAVCVAIVFLILGLLFTLIIAWFKNFVLTRMVSYFLFSWYTIYVVIAILTNFIFTATIPERKSFSTDQKSCQVGNKWVLWRTIWMFHIVEMSALSKGMGLEAAYSGTCKA